MFIILIFKGSRNEGAFDKSVQTELQLPVSQVLALFAKLIKKISKRLVDIQKAAIRAELPIKSTNVDDDDRKKESKEMKTKEGWKSVSSALEDELNEAGNEATKRLREKQREMIDALDLQK